MKKTINLLIAIFILFSWGYAQESDKTNTPKLKFDNSGQVKYIKFDGKNKTGKWDSPSSANEFFKSILGATEQDEFVLKNKREPKNGVFTEHYRQFYHGVAVEGGLFILHFKNGKLTKANGHFVNTNGIDLSPALTPEDAAKSYAAHLQITDNLSPEFIHGLVVAEIETISGADTTYSTRLCYKVDLKNCPSDKGETGYIDAHTAEILKTQKNWFNSSATGTFATMYSGSRNAGTQYYNGVFNLIDSSRNAIINTWDLNNNDWDNYADSAVVFTDNDNNWTANEHDDNDDQMALDIHWALQEIYDYFDNEHSLQSFDNNNHMIDAFVHCELPDGAGGTTRENAMFNVFASGDQAFFFGDGESDFKPLGALDVVAHEFSHAITYNHTGWATLTTLRRALHEGFSDIWGAVIENEIASEKDHWKIGEEVIDVSGDDCLRNIQTPESSAAYQPIADCFGDSRYNDGGNDEAYEKSGVLSHWFYLLAEGGEDTNDNNDDYLVYKLGLDVAAEVALEGQTGHFADVTDYTDARDAMIDAADAIFDENSFQSLQVEEAWYAVGVGTQPAQVTLSGDNLICNSGEVITANNSPTGSTINWTTSSNLKVDSGQGTTTPTIKPKYSSSNGVGWVQANYVTGSYTTAGPRKTVWVGKILPLGLGLVDRLTGMPKYVFCNGQANPVKAVHVDGEASIIEWDWDVTGGYVYYDNPYGDNSEVTIYPTSTSCNVKVNARNGCDWSGWADMGIYVMSCGGYYMMISPNPTTGETTLTIEPTSEEETFDETAEWELEIYSPTQALKEKKTKLKGNSTTIQTQSWKEGVYVVRVKYKDEILSGKLVVKK